MAVATGIGNRDLTILRSKAVDKPMVRPRPLNVDLLRRRIDQGSGADKVAYSDPASAPLGTDDEAAGNPPDREQIEMAAAELAQPPTTRWRADRLATLLYLGAVATVGATIVAIVAFA